jgi:hypothetical protein
MATTFSNSFKTTAPLKASGTQNLVTTPAPLAPAKVATSATPNNVASNQTVNVNQNQIDALAKAFGGTSSAVPSNSQVNVPSTIPVTALRNTPAPIPTQPAPANYSQNLNNATSGVFNTPTQEVPQTQQEKDNASYRQYIESLTNPTTGESAKRATYQTEQGVADKQAKLNALDLEVEKLNKSYQDKQNLVLNKNPEGLFGGAAQQLLSQDQMALSSRKADIALEKLALQGDLTQANTIIQQKLDAEFNPIKEKLAYMKEFASFAQNDLSESEKIKLQADIANKTAETKALETAKQNAYELGASLGMDSSFYNKIQGAQDVASVYKTLPNTVTANVNNLPIEKGETISATGKIITTPKKAVDFGSNIQAKDEFKSIQKSISSLNYLNNFAKKFNETGATSIFTPFDESALKPLYNSAVLDLKEFFNLGVLSGPDLEQIKGILPDPTSHAFNPLAAKATENGINAIKSNINEALDQRFSNLYSQYSAYDIKSIPQLESVTKNYIRAKAQVDPKTAKLISDNPNLSIEDLIQVIIP